MERVGEGGSGGRGAGAAGRLARAERREALLDVAASLAAQGSPEAITMEAVAEHAGVSRPLVYRHFPNRDELVAAVFQRETTHLHEQLTAEVSAAGTIVDMFGALAHGALRAAAEQGHLFATLRSAGAWSPEVRRQQRARTRPPPAPSASGRPASWGPTARRRGPPPTCCCRSSTRCWPAGATTRRPSTPHCWRRRTCGSCRRHWPPSPARGPAPADRPLHPPPWGTKVEELTTCHYVVQLRTAVVQSEGAAMTYAGTRRILDADSHLMELADFLDGHIDADYRDQLRRTGMEALEPVLDRRGRPGRPPPGRRRGRRGGRGPPPARQGLAGHGGLRPGRAQPRPRPARLRGPAGVRHVRHLDVRRARPGPPLRRRRRPEPRRGRLLRGRPPPAAGRLRAAGRPRPGARRRSPRRSSWAARR